MNEDYSDKMEENVARMEWESEQAEKDAQWSEKPLMPNPTSEQMETPEFKAVWNCVKSWDVNVPEFYNAYCGANGSHVMLILNALREAKVF